MSSEFLGHRLMIPNSVVRLAKMTSKNCGFRFGFGFTKLTVVFCTVCCLMCMTLEMTYFRAELVQLIVSRSDPELEVQRYGVKENTFDC